MGKVCLSEYKVRFESMGKTCPSNSRFKRHGMTLQALVGVMEQVFHIH